jgi:hypothetical protein
MWFQNDLKRPNAAMLQFLQRDEEVQQFMLCSNCWTSVKQGEVSTLSKSNSFTYPPKPTHLPPVCPLSERLTSPYYRLCSSGVFVMRATAVLWAK